MSSDADDELRCRVHDGAEPTLVYLPGVHGDWTLVGSFRAALRSQVRFVEFCYPRTLTWTLADYGKAIRRALDERGLERVWLLGESFGSQVAWALLECARGAGTPRIDGIILAGGFARYPFPLLVRGVRWAMARMPSESWKWIFAPYAKYAQFRHRHAPEARRGVAEFLERRTPLDLSAILHRLDLIAANNPSPIALVSPVPIFALTGGIDPVVLPWPTIGWLRRNCPSFREMRMIWLADHNVLATQPVEAAKTVLRWINLPTL